MSLFSKILHKLGLHKKEQEPVAPAPAAARPASAAVSAPTPKRMSARAAAVAPAPKPATPVRAVAKPQNQHEDPRVSRPVVPVAPKPISEVDVVKHLEELSRGKNLNWKVSIADLLTLLELENSYAARVELAKELECPAELMSDSAKMNTWLHKTVLRMIAENGGNIPRELID